MYTTTNIHMNTGSISEPHNWRDKDMILAENSHNSGNYIDISNEFDDSFHITLYRSTLIEKYNELFGEALKEYNDKQKRSDRKITMNEYMDSVENDTRGKRQTKLVNGKKVADYSKQKGKRLSYELTTAVGNTECAKGDDKRVCYDKTNHQIRPEYLPRILQLKIILEYCKSFQERNPYFAVVNIDIHGDELYLNQRNVWEYAVIHAHIEFIPFAEGFKQGLSTQNSMNKALAAMGIEYGKDRRCPYEIWCEKERKYMEELTYKMYEEYCKKIPISMVKTDLFIYTILFLTGAEWADLIKKLTLLKKSLRNSRQIFKWLWKKSTEQKMKMMLKNGNWTHKNCHIPAEKLA